MLFSFLLYWVIFENYVQNAAIIMHFFSSNTPKNSLNCALGASSLRLVIFVIGNHVGMF